MEDYQRAVERLDSFAAVSQHDVVVHSERPAGLAERAAQIGDAEAIVLIRERTPIDEPLLELLPHLRLICQTGRGRPTSTWRRAPGAGSPSAPAPGRRTPRRS